MEKNTLKELKKRLTMIGMVTALGTTGCSANYQQKPEVNKSIESLTISNDEFGREFSDLTPVYLLEDLELIVENPCENAEGHKKYSFILNNVMKEETYLEYLGNNLELFHNVCTKPALTSNKTFKFFSTNIFENHTFNKGVSSNYIELSDPFVNVETSDKAFSSNNVIAGCQNFPLPEKYKGRKSLTVAEIKRLEEMYNNEEIKRNDEVLAAHLNLVLIDGEYQAFRYVGKSTKFQHSANNNDVVLKPFIYQFYSSIRNPELGLTVKYNNDSYSCLLDSSNPNLLKELHSPEAVTEVNYLDFIPEEYYDRVSFTEKEILEYEDAINNTIDKPMTLTKVFNEEN